MDFTKLQGVGNDFVLVETDDTSRDWAYLSQSFCDRRFGIGADGLVLLMASNKADFRMRIFNSDGSEAEACGNGLRCLIRYILERGLADASAEELVIETMAGVRKARIKRTENGLPVIQVGLGSPVFKAEDIPVNLDDGSGEEVDIKYPLSRIITVNNCELMLHFVSMGNPHAIYFTEQPVVAFPLAQMGHEVEHHRMFPQRTNFEVVRVLGQGRIEARVWERGVGETLACGSGAAAIAVAARLLGYTGDSVDIKLPGGILHVDWAGQGEVLLSGPAEIVFTGQWPE